MLFQLLKNCLFLPLIYYKPLRTVPFDLNLIIWLLIILELNYLHCRMKAFT